MKEVFDRAGFMAYLHRTFSGFDNSFLRGTVENLIDYAIKEKNTSKDQLCYFLFDMLPEVEIHEIAAFCGDEILTDFGKSKKEFAKQHGVK